METAKKYFIIHNSNLKYTADTLDEAIKLVEKKVDKLATYYQTEIGDSVYNIIINIETENKSEIRYNITGHYKFVPNGNVDMSIEVNTVFETFQII